MPLISSDYRPPFAFRSGHLSTIYSGLFRKVVGLQQKRERIELWDGDFMDLDWSFADGASRKTTSGKKASAEKTSPKKAFLTRENEQVKSYKKTSRKVVILLHGLEGHAQRPYITGSAKAFNDAGIDACAVNFRGCSGETNRLYRSYHSGATDDLDAVVQHILSNKKYDKIYIKGVSLGGNMALKYVGEDRTVPKEIKAVIGISAPCDLYSSLKELLKPKNYAYSVRFRNHLVAKLELKHPLFPNRISKADIQKINNLKDFDDIYTAPAHGFEDALDYYEKCSCRQFLSNVRVPSLIINARNDSFLGPECYPYKEAEENKFIHLETPKFGGHVGFIAPGNHYYSEKKAIKFLEEAI
ncbi:MAG: alpha/beta fold hydrolase [Pricia sp.]